jgi:hypothetical protein
MAHGIFSFEETLDHSEKVELLSIPPEAGGDDCRIVVDAWVKDSGKSKRRFKVLKKPGFAIALISI